MKCGEIDTSLHIDLKRRRYEQANAYAYMSPGKSVLRCHMPSAKDLIERARMFDERADQAIDPISRQHYREMAAHYRSLSVEHCKAARPEPEPAHYEGLSDR